MDKLASLDWSLVQSFLAVAETGSLSAAAKALRTSQPTVGRHIRSLEAELEVELFHRHARGLHLTPLGQDMAASARDMQEAVRRIGIRAAGAREALEGDVRITASVFMSHHVLPWIIGDIRRKEPHIRIDLVATDETENLLFRESDIAVRMYRPTQLDTITRHLGDIALGFYATEDYVARMGLPEVPDDLIRHDLVGYDRNEVIIHAMREQGWPATRDWFKVRSDNQSAVWELIRAGCGIGFCQTHVGDTTPGMVRILPDYPLPTLPVWLTAPEAMRHTPRISRVWDLLSEGLLPFVS